MISNSNHKQMQNKNKPCSKIISQIFKTFYGSCCLNLCLNGCLFNFLKKLKSLKILHLLGPQIKLVISKNSKVFLSFCVPTLLSICAVHQTNLKILLHHYVISHLINLPVLWIFFPSLVQLYTIFLHILSIFTGKQVISYYSCNN